MRHPPETDINPTPGVTAVIRTVKGEPEIVVVCERCESIHTVTVQEAMRVALHNWMKCHEEDRHNSADAQQGEPT